jgi:hypothetical protein
MHAVAPSERRADADVNAVVAGYLRDLAFAQSSEQKMFGYKPSGYRAPTSTAAPLPEPRGSPPHSAGRVVVWSLA